MRNLGLDLLRIMAVILVIGRHLHLPPNSHAVLEFWKTGGWVGVDLFFVLSGFLVSSLLFKEYLKYGRVDALRFLLRRGFKIYPAFWLFLVVSLAVQYYYGQFPPLKSVLGEILFVQNYLGGVWNHTWSLAVEEHFYLGIAALFSCLIAIRPKSSFSSLPAIFAIVAAVCLSLRVTNLVVYPTYSHRAYLIGTHLRVDSLLFGVVIAYFWYFQNLKRRLAEIPTWQLLSAGICLLSPAFAFPLEANRWVSVLGVVLFYVGSGLILLGAVRLERSDSRVLNFLGALGGASYSIYLWHLPVGTWGYRLVRDVTGIDSHYLYLLNAVVGACALGWILNRIIENPVLSLRERLVPSKASPFKVAK